jgi:hypothetical protein
MEKHPGKAFCGIGNPIEKELTQLRRDKGRLEEKVDISKKPFITSIMFMQKGL